MQRFTQYLAWFAAALTVLFAALNIPALMTTTSLNFIVAQIQAPVGVILLGAMLVFMLLFFVASMSGRIAHLMESRRMHKEVLDAQQLVSKAENSRLESMQQVMLGEFRSLNERLARMEMSQTPLVKLDQ